MVIQTQLVAMFGTRHDLNRACSRLSRAGVQVVREMVAWTGEQDIQQEP